MYKLQNWNGMYVLSVSSRKSKRAEEENPVTNPYDNTDEHADGISNKGFERDSHDQQTVMWLNWWPVCVVFGHSRLFE